MLDMRKAFEEIFSKIQSERLEEFAGYDEVCQRELDAFESKAEGLISNMAADQEKERSAYVHKLREELNPKYPTYTQQTLRWKKTAEILFKQKDYRKAQQHFNFATKGEAADKAKWQEAREKRIIELERQLTETHRVAM